ncbi:NAD(P)-binding protein [Cylindrobasidium torrendii FP15055 ss-10]|uniref:NAD(P)-binding protein n=1 Tax=Cylindrobasidium torrendii FP15055 ss-10 TaxID=1314674 RepID=A0A0D7B2J6_9AGAR|nr:NAD(P)-binding protein [Cylindrobasidium torrendii FP15055 ss-10]
MSLEENPVVLVVGATGYTGRTVVQHLLESGEYRVSILVREKSLDKPSVKEFKAAGANVLVGDVSQPQDVLEGYLKGVDILVILTLIMVDQMPILRAAKQVGTLKRVVPSDFGPSIPRGVTDMYDKKLDVREYIKELGLPYTFIEVGWWLSILLPCTHAAKASPVTPKNRVGNQDRKTIISSWQTIGLLTAKVLNDPRTLNQVVVVHDGEMSPKEAFALGEKVTGEDFSDYEKIPDEVILERAKSTDVLTRLCNQYFTSLFIRGDNVLSGAKARGALDARALYPDVPYPDLEAEAKDIYNNPYNPDLSVVDGMTV